MEHWLDTTNLIEPSKSLVCDLCDVGMSKRSLSSRITNLNAGKKLIVTVTMFWTERLQGKRLYGLELSSQCVDSLSNVFGWPITESPKASTCSSSDGGCRPDIIEFEAGSFSCDMELDVYMTHPWSGDVISKAVQENGVAAAKREEQKTSKNI